MENTKEFDACQHKITQVVLKAGAIIRELKSEILILKKLEGLPEERNVTKLFNETAPLLGVAANPMNTTTHGTKHPFVKFPNLEETDLPKKDCPACGAISVLWPICQSCKDSENNKYKSGYKCSNSECGLVFDKSEMHLSKRLSSMGKEVPTGTKQELGIKTITDEGLK